MPRNIGSALYLISSSSKVILKSKGVERGDGTNSGISDGNPVLALVVTAAMGLVQAGIASEIIVTGKHYNLNTIGVAYDKTPI